MGDRICGQLLKPPAEGIPLQDFQLLTSAVGIARSEAKGREKRRSREEREKKEREAALERRAKASDRLKELREEIAEKHSAELEDITSKQKVVDEASEELVTA